MGFIFYFSVRRESCSHLTPLLFSSNLYVFDEMEEKHSFGVHERDWVWDHRRHRLLPLVVMTKVLMEHFTIYKIGLKSSCWHRKQSKRKQKKKKNTEKKKQKGWMKFSFESWANTQKRTMQEDKRACGGEKIMCRNTRWVSVWKIELELSVNVGTLLISGAHWAAEITAHYVHITHEISN